MKGIRMTRVQGALTQFVGADLRNSDCSDSIFDQTVWTGANVEQADFHNSRLRRSVLQKVSACKADFGATDLAYSDFSYADIGCANFRDARFTQTLFHRASEEGTLWSNQTGIIQMDSELFAAESWSEQYHPEA
jgi:uncharacterized protein YjbI with pentapeptide repeats